MNTTVHVSGATAKQLREIVSEALGCRPERTAQGERWEPHKDRIGIGSVLLRPCSSERHELDVVLAEVPESAAFSLTRLWGLTATIVKETELTGIPVTPSVPATNGRRQITARLTLRNAPLDLARVGRLSSALGLLDQCAKTIQTELPPMSAAGITPRVPRELMGVVRPLTARMKHDTGIANITGGVLTNLQAGLSVALAGSPLRARLELDRLARAASNLVVLQQQARIPKVPQLARLLKDAGLILAAPASFLRPQHSVYEQGREIESVLNEMASGSLPLLAFARREELEALFGVGQGRSYSALMPVIEALPPADKSDLVGVALAEGCAGVSAARMQEINQLVIEAASLHPETSENDLLQSLANLASSEPSSPDLPVKLKSLANDLSSRRETFGTIEASPAEERPDAVNRHLRRTFGGDAFETHLRSKILGQEGGLRELTQRLFRESIARADKEPLRVLLAGPVGTGKSMLAKSVADSLCWQYHYVDAASFDSPNAVMTSLAGVSPGIVSSYNDGVLTKISRRPSVVEVADIDHALPGVRGALCEFFLRILQEGTLQSGSGMVVRTLASGLYIFTTNVAHGKGKAGNSIGFAPGVSRDSVRSRVVEQAIRDLGHAFISRTGQPVLFDVFTDETATQVAALEVSNVVKRVTGAAVVNVEPRVPEQIVASLPTMETGARGIMDATRDALAEALRGCINNEGVERVTVYSEEGEISIKPTALYSPTTETAERTPKETTYE